MAQNTAKSPVIVGLDPSLTGFGVCIFDLQDGPAFHRISVKSEGTILANRFSRYDKILLYLDQVLHPLTNVAGVFLEGYSYGSKGRATVSLGEFGGMLRVYLLKKFPLLVWEVAPKTLKSFAAGNGNSDSASLKVELEKHFQLEIPSEDEAVAFAACLAGATFLGYTEPENVKQTKAIEAIKTSLEERSQRKTRK